MALDGHLELQVGDEAVTAASVLIPAGERHGVRAVTGRIVGGLGQVRAAAESSGAQVSPLSWHWEYSGAQ